MGKLIGWIRRVDFSLVISVIALVLSGLTWVDVRQQLKLAAGQSRSYVQVVDARLKEPIASASFIQVDLTIKNFGATAAVNVYGEMDYQLDSPGLKGGGNEATRRQFGAMGPGMERAASLTSNRRNRRDWPVPILERHRSIYFYGTIWFTDETTQESRKEDWCYRLPIRTDADLQRYNLDSCGTLSYKSKDGPLRE